MQLKKTCVDSMAVRALMPSLEVELSVFMAEKPRNYFFRSQITQIESRRKMKQMSKMEPRIIHVCQVRNSATAAVVSE